MKRLPKLLVLISFFVSFGGSSVRSQELPSDAKTKLISELITVMKADQQMPQMMDAMLVEFDKSYASLYHAGIDADSTLTAAEKVRAKAETDKRRAAFNQKFRQRLQERIDYTKYVRDLIYPIYSNAFTEKELRDILAFYKSESGQRFIDAMPRLMTESVRASQQKLMPQITPIIDELIKEEFGAASFNTPPPPPAKKKP